VVVEVRLVKVYRAWEEGEVGLPEKIYLAWEEEEEAGRPEKIYLASVEGLLEKIFPALEVVEVLLQ
jgi:hypothetical protein